MASPKIEDLQKITNIMEMCQVLAKLGISLEGVQTIDEMRALAIAEIAGQSSEKPSWSPGQAFSILSEAKIEDERKRKMLLNHFSKADTFLNKLDEKDLPLLQRRLASIKVGMKRHIEQLEQKEYYTLVAGETGAGKSSLINLIMGEELLPYSLLSTTSAICELKYGEERKVVAHFKNTDSETGLPTKTIFLVNPVESSGQSYLQQISPYVHMKSADREKGSVYKKIEIFWPHPLLKKGVIIIDSPGIGESEIMDEMVLEYLPQAFAFIYVINIANAGGVQKDRLEYLLKEVSKTTEKRREEFPSKCALFVCNKWDQVPNEEIDEVKDDIVKKLTDCWPGLIPESQIIYMSTKKASDAQNRGDITADFLTLMNGIGSFVSKSIEARLEIHWKWLDDIIYQLICQAKTVTMNASRDHDKLKQKMNSILYRLDYLEKQQTQLMEKIRKDMKARANDAEQKLSDYLNSADAKARILTVFENRSRWPATFFEELERQLHDVVQEWEDDNHVFANAFKSPVQQFLEHHNCAKMQILNLEHDITGVAFSVIYDPIFLTVQTGKFFKFFFKLLAVVIKSILRNSTIDEDISHMAKVFLDGFTDRKVFNSLVNEMLEKYLLCLEQIETQIPQMILANKTLYNELLDRKHSHKEIEEVYKPIMDDASALRGNLAVFGMREVRAADISNKELQWKEDTSSRLGCGMFATVYQGKMRRHGHEQAVALKVCNKPLDATNACLVIAEEANLRNLNHPHIVKFYGTALVKKQDATRVIFVMERCKGNLKDQLFKHQEYVPGISGKPACVREACRWVREITAALDFMHKKGVVHRDLKLENILLSEENSVRICDVGVSKEAKDITGTFTGSRAYMAPEVFHSELYDFKADIYSFGVMLWEIWFGRRAFGEVEAPTTLFRSVDEGYRPKDVEGLRKPLRRWKALMEKCWDGNPEERPTAENCKEEITELSSEWNGF